MCQCCIFCCREEKEGWVVNHHTRVVDCLPADHTCCDICPSHTVSSLLPHTTSLLGIDAPNGSRQRLGWYNLASFDQSRRRCLLLQVPASNWHQLSYFKNTLDCCNIKLKIIKVRVCQSLAIRISLIFYLFCCATHF